MKTRILALAAALSLTLSLGVHAADVPADSRLGDVFVSATLYEPIQFSDVSDSDWYFASVRNAVRYGLMNGKGNNLFAPGDTLTVVEALALAARVHAAYNGLVIPNYAQGEWYLGVVTYASTYSLPIVGEYTDPATREYFCHVMAAALPASELWSNGSSLLFADEGLMSYTDDIYLLARAGIVNGIPDGVETYFRPGATITRAEAAAIIHRMVVPDGRV